MKARGWWANITIAVSRGCLLKVAGWGCVASVVDMEPWFIGFIFMLFLLGASSSKDFSDYEGDKADGLRTLPVIYGMEKTARLITPFFIVPWLVMIAGILKIPNGPFPILHANPAAVVMMSFILAVYGVYIARSMRNFSVSSIEGNHPAWKHMYLMMMTGQIGLVVCYLI
jgi:4-hydroxybenzoate polyprenyltransferase